jgi:dipeptidyl aminopeptidase/acylaminoacyl peptidase
VVGISNWVSFLQNTESYRRDLRRVEYGDERDPAMRQFLQDISPLTHAAKISKPLMVVQGKNDPRVPWTESEQIVRSLQGAARRCGTCWPTTKATVLHAAKTLTTTSRPTCSLCSRR